MSVRVEPNLTSSQKHTNVKGGLRLRRVRVRMRTTHSINEE